MRSGMGAAVYSARISVVTAPVVAGAYGGMVRDWDQATVRRVPFGVELQPGGRMEETENGSRVFVRSGWRLITPPGRLLDVAPTDRIRVDGWDHDLDVVGETGDWDHPMLRHTELDLEVSHG